MCHRVVVVDGESAAGHGDESVAAESDYRVGGSTGPAPERRGVERADSPDRLHIRREYLRRRAFAEQGVYLLLGGIIVFLLSCEIAQACRKPLPVPQPDAGKEEWAAAALSRRSVVALALVLGGVLVTVRVALTP